MTRVNINSFTLDIIFQLLKRVALWWINCNTMREGNKPNNSEESQFHQPPQVPSCKAHQLPHKREIKLIVKANFKRKDEYENFVLKVEDSFSSSNFATV